MRQSDSMFRLHLATLLALLGVAGAGLMALGDSGVAKDEIHGVETITRNYELVTHGTPIAPPRPSAWSGTPSTRSSPASNKSTGGRGSGRCSVTRAWHCASAYCAARGRPGWARSCSRPRPGSSVTRCSISKTSHSPPGLRCAVWQGRSPSPLGWITARRTAALTGSGPSPWAGSRASWAEYALAVSSPSV